MGRWEPNALERLQEAAMALFLEYGYDRTTVSEIAARAKLTERTFFRYFTDKREVLFSGSEQLEKLVVDGITTAPKSMAPLDAVVAGLEATAPMFEQRRAHARERQGLIAAHTELHERELIKLARLTSAMAACLRERGVPQNTANLVAEIGIVLFKSAFERWVNGSKKHDLAHYVHATRVDLRLVVTGSSAKSSSTTPRKRARSPGRPGSASTA
ncbi:TetR/AcrR family transcriptional regulator [Chondromyces crocatus]|nr:TetR/AcrR family transcriptional regulator [Chondromyces crocatus]